MPDFLDLIESVDADHASESRLFGDAGTSVRARRANPRYGESLLEAARLIERVYSGSRLAALQFQEAMTTDDFPYLFGDVLDRQILARYAEYPQNYRAWVRVRDVRDFRTVKRFALDGAEGQLSKVPQITEYPAASLSDTYDSYSVEKYGRRLHFTWEDFINDDLDAFRDNADRLARGARRTEQKFATSLYIDTNGPHASLYTVGHANKVTGNPVLTVAALQTAYTVLAAMKDDDNEPIFIDGVTLVVPPALEVVANNIKNAVEIRTAAGSSSATVDRITTGNWLGNKLTVEVDPYIPIVAATANGATTWALFADPNRDRPALEMGFLRGHTTPELFMKRGDAQRVGGGDNPMDGDFDTDSLQWKVRHVLGGTQLNTTKGYKSTVASNGSGS